MNPEIIQMIERAVKEHLHDGVLAQQINEQDIFGLSEGVNVQSETIATTGNTDAYMIAPRNLSVNTVNFSGTDALAASDTNYITWTITNLGQDGSGTKAVLLASDLNTTKATGGSAITANSKRTMTLNTAVNNLDVNEGDRLRIRAAVTGTLANSVTFPVYLIKLR